MTAPLLTTKIHIPPVRTELVSRPRLLTRLDGGLKHKLMLVSAPAGFGKTTLLSEWLQARPPDAPSLTAAWLSLDEADNDPARFLLYLVAAVRAAQEGSWDDTLADQYASQPPPREETLTRLINQVAALPHRLALVLDDYHLITAPSVHDALAFLLDHLPDNLCLILATRSDPPLQLPRLRARGQLLELRQANLRLTPDEAAAFLNQVMGLGLSPGDVAALERRTEGWIAGLQMAALAMRGSAVQRTPASQGTPGQMGSSEFVQAFTGSHRFILDYLIEEVLDQQSPDIQEFLLQTSILERLTGPLCDAVRFGLAKAPSSPSGSAVRFGLAKAPSSPSGSAVRFGLAKAPSSPSGSAVRFGLAKAPSSPSGSAVRSDLAQAPDSQPGAGVPRPAASQPVLERLDAANLFIVPLDDERCWYRYHRLFSDLLRKRLHQTQRDLVPELHRRASKWHEQQGMMAAAIDHALAAEDFERAADLIEEQMEATLMRSEVATFMSWVERLPGEQVRTRPTLCFYHAWTLLMSGGSLEAVEQRLQDIACMQETEVDAGDKSMSGRMAALRAYTTLFQADTGHTVELCRQALESLPESDQFLRGVVTWMLSLARVADGDLKNGSQALTEVARKGQAIGNPMIAVTALCYQAKLQVRQGRPHRAREILERALQLATDRQGQRLPIASEPLIGLGGLFREWNELEIAADYLAQGIELAKQWSELAAFDAYIPLARTRQAQGDAQGAREAIETAQRIAERSEVTEADDLVIEMQQAYFSIRQGDVEAARRWAERRGLLPGTPREPDSGAEHGQDFLRARLRKYEHLVLARLFTAQDLPAKAFALLDPLLAKARQLQRVDLIIDIQIQRALAAQVEGREALAMEALAEALSRTEPGGYMRTFLDEGQAMAGLLRQAASRGIAPAYVARLLAGFDKTEPKDVALGLPDHPAQPLVEPLSEREMDVLRLLAAGMSNPDIAEELTVAVSTVRSHCKSIYGKLNVHRRWDAVHRARELGLL